MIEPPFELEMPLIDLSDLAEAERASETRKLAAAEAKTAFDLSTGPLIRVKLIREEKDNHIILLTLHHIIADAWSKLEYLSRNSQFDIRLTARVEMKLPRHYQSNTSTIRSGKGIICRGRPLTVTCDTGEHVLHRCHPSSIYPRIILDPGSKRIIGKSIVCNDTGNSKST